ncbi:PilZ domain-containing protein [bacterium]|nr:PilZ domain-containing protein [bacterium]
MPPLRQRSRESGGLQELVDYAADRLALLRLQNLRESLADVEDILRSLKHELDIRRHDGRNVRLTEQLVWEAEQERARLLGQISQAVDVPGIYPERRRRYESGESYERPLDTRARITQHFAQFYRPEPEYTREEYVNVSDRARYYRDQEYEDESPYYYSRPESLERSPSRGSREAEPPTRPSFELGGTGVKAVRESPPARSAETPGWLSVRVDRKTRTPHASAELNLGEAREPMAPLGRSRPQPLQLGRASETKKATFHASQAVGLSWLGKTSARSQAQEVTAEDLPAIPSDDEMLLEEDALLLDSDLELDDSELLDDELDLSDLELGDFELDGELDVDSDLGLELDDEDLLLKDLDLDDELLLDEDEAELVDDELAEPYLDDLDLELEDDLEIGQFSEAELQVEGDLGEVELEDLDLDAEVDLGDLELDENDLDLSDLEEMDLAGLDFSDLELDDDELLALEDLSLSDSDEREAAAEIDSRMTESVIEPSVVEPAPVDEEPVALEEPLVEVSLVEVAQEEPVAHEAPLVEEEPVAVGPSAVEEELVELEAPPVEFAMIEAEAGPVEVEELPIEPEAPPVDFAMAEEEPIAVGLAEVEAEPIEPEAPPVEVAIAEEEPLSVGPAEVEEEPIEMEAPPVEFAIVEAEPIAERPTEVEEEPVESESPPVEVAIAEDLVGTAEEEPVTPEAGPEEASLIEEEIIAVGPSEVEEDAELEVTDVVASDLNSLPPLEDVDTSEFFGGMPTAELTFLAEDELFASSEPQSSIETQLPLSEEILVGSGESSFEGDKDFFSDSADATTAWLDEPLTESVEAPDWLKSPDEELPAVAGAPTVESLEAVIEDVAAKEALETPLPAEVEKVAPAPVTPPHPFDQGASAQERRRLVRLSCSYDTTAYFEGRPAPVKLVDISLGGGKLVGPNSFQRGQLIQVSNPLPEAKINEPVTARIVWIRPNKDEEGRFDIGLQFEESPEILGKSWVITVLNKIGMQSKVFNQRKYTRAVANLPIEIDLLVKERIPGTALDIGLGGALLAVDRPLSPTTRFNLYMGPLGNHEALELRCEVISSRHDEGGAGWTHSAKFAEISTTQTKLLGRYVVDLLKAGGSV